MRPGRLLAVEDEASVERKRAYRWTDGKRWMAALGVPMLFLLALSGRGGPTDDLWAFGLLLGPFWLLMGAAKIQGPSHGLTGPIKIYENGLAMKPPGGEYSFIPWGVSELYFISERRGMGRVLTVPMGLHTVEFLASMRDYDVVERVVKRKRVPDAKLSVWGPGPSPSR